MKFTRRGFWQTAAVATGMAALARAGSRTSGATDQRGYTPVETPDGATLPYVMKEGVKEFHLIAEPVKREFAPGMIVNCWGYNGMSPGPTIEAVEVFSEVITVYIDYAGAPRQQAKFI